MTTWNVTIRNKNGGLESIAVQAPDRAAVFAEMRAKGVSVVRIDEAAVKKNAGLRIDAAAVGKWVKRLVACAVVIAAVALAAMWYFHVDLRDIKPGKVMVKPSAKGNAANAKGKGGDKGAAKPKSAKAVAAEFQEKAKEFVKKAVTNQVEWIVPPLDPDDPDNAMRTAVAQDIGSLLSIVPGEEIPPIIPFGFMFEGDEDDESEEASDGGNKAFIESLKKWKLTVKDTDTKERAEAKKRIAEAQIELLDNIGKGLTVNDSIRAAYDYRVRAAATRNSFIDAIKEVYEQDGNADLARQVMKDMNKRLAEEGILEIAESDVLPEAEVEEEDK